MAALERAALVYACNNFNFDEYWILAFDFQLVWVANGGVVGDLRWELLLSYYGFEAGTVEIIPDEPVEVYFCDPALVLGMLAWMIEFGFDCPTGGDIVNFPEPGFNPCNEA